MSTNFTTSQFYLVVERVGLEPTSALRLAVFQIVNIAVTILLNLLVGSADSESDNRLRLKAAIDSLPNYTLRLQVLH